MNHDNAQIADSMSQAAMSTLENLAFTEVAVRAGARFSREASAYRGAGISLGPWGRLELAMDKGLLEDIACTLYSLDIAEVSEQCLGDASCEILNIIGGRFVSGLARDKEDFDLGLPSAREGSGGIEAMPVKCLMAGEDGKELALGWSPA